MREADPLSQQLALWLLYLVLAIAGLSQLPRVVNTIRQAVQQPVQTTTRKVTL